METQGYNSHNRPMVGCRGESCEGSDAPSLLISKNLDITDKSQFQIAFNVTAS